jgi:ribosome-associated heat shock protein Hsp15
MSSQSQRSDLWLYYSRIYKTRALSAKACESGIIRHINAHGQTRLTKPSQALHIDDELIIMIAGQLRHIKIKALGLRRGPASEAAQLYVDKTEL